MGCKAPNPGGGGGGKDFGGKDWGKGKKGDDFGKGKDDFGKGKGDAFGGVMMPWMKGKGKDDFGKGKGGVPFGNGKGGGKPGWKDDGSTPGYWDDYTPGKYYEEPGGVVGVEGLRDAMTRAIEPHMHTEKQWKPEDMVNKICMSIFKVATKWYKDDTRHKEAGSSIQAQALLEEFTEKIMAGLASVCHDKPWFTEIYLSEGVALAAINTFKGGALFKRTVAPIIVTHVDEAIHRYREEERHQKVMWDAVSTVGIKSDYHKKANKHLATSFEAAHIAAKYGTSQAMTPALGMVQDFVMAWIRDFCKRAWDILANGISSSTPDQQIAVVTMLFQYFCDPAHTCLPVDLVSQLDMPPPANWDFIAQAVIQLWAENAQYAGN